MDSILSKFEYTNNTSHSVIHTTNSVFWGTGRILDSTHDRIRSCNSRRGVFRRCVIPLRVCVRIDDWFGLTSLTLWSCHRGIVDNIVRRWVDLVGVVDYRSIFDWRNLLIDWLGVATHNSSLVVDRRIMEDSVLGQCRVVRRGVGPQSLGAGGGGSVGGAWLSVHRDGDVRPGAVRL